jgi:hypothetical protein
VEQELPAIGQRPNRSKFFREYVGLNDHQIAAIRRGTAIAKVIDTRTPDEVFVFGSVYVEATPESYLRFASDIDALRKLPSFLAIRKFSDPPQLSDLDGFTLEKDDVKQLKNCKPGHCGIRLPAEVHGTISEDRELVGSDAEDRRTIWRSDGTPSGCRYSKGGTSRLARIAIRITRHRWRRPFSPC